MDGKTAGFLDEMTFNEDKFANMEEITAGLDDERAGFVFYTALYDDKATGLNEETAGLNCKKLWLVE